MNGGATDELTTHLYVDINYANFNLRILTFNFQSALFCKINVPSFMYTLYFFVCHYIAIIDLVIIKKKLSVDFKNCLGYLNREKQQSMDM